MERKTIYWNELSEQTKLVLRELSEQTKLVLPAVKITHSIENGCSVLMFEPEKKETTFYKGQILRNLIKEITFENKESFKTYLTAIREATIEEKDAFLFSQNKMINENGVVVRWKPKCRKSYFICDPLDSNLFEEFIWDNDLDDNRYYNYNMTFSTASLAIEATQKMLNSLK